MSNFAQPDPNTDDGFRAALAQAVATGHANDPGVGAGSDPGTADPAATSAQTTPQVSADTQALLERFGGVDGLAQAFASGQTMIGNQGNELGELRQRLEAIEQSVAPSAAPSVFMSPDQIEQAVAEYGGQTVLEYLEKSNPALIQPALEAWGEVDPFRAALFVFGRIQAEQSAQGEQATGLPQEFEDILVERNLSLTAEAASTKYPDWGELADFIGPALEGAPQAVQALVVSDDPQEREVGVDILVRFAREGKTAYESTPEGQQALAAARAATQVTTGSLTPLGAVGGNPGKPNETDAVAAFKESIRQAPTTSIFDGLQVPQGRQNPLG